MNALTCLLYTNFVGVDVGVKGMGSVMGDGYWDRGWILDAFSCLCKN